MRSRKDNGLTQIFVVVSGVFLLSAVCFLSVKSLIGALPAENVSYPLVAEIAPVLEQKAAAVEATPAFVVTHIPTPDSVKAVYMTSWAAGNAKFRRELFDLIDTTEVNAVVIDVKDYSGHISFPVNDPELKKTGASEKRIPDVKEFISKLHDKGVYVIARISSFQDSFLINVHPEWAVKNGAGGIWQDYKGVKWLDAGAQPVWEYLAAIGRESYADGFDELNFDYIRYPSDGPMKDLVYSWSDGRTRQVVMRSFFEYLHEQFSAGVNGAPIIPISADLFGLTTSAADDLGIGQNLGDALVNFDFVAPMVYPSHYAHGFNGYAKPALYPYEVVKYAMDEGIKKALIATSSPLKIRPWLQAFDLGAVYTPAMVRAQIQASYDAGLNSWMLWDAASVYDKKDLMLKGEEMIVGTTTGAGR
jgi:hypothetical protein